MENSLAKRRELRLLEEKTAEEAKRFVAQFRAEKKRN
jgi:hypothetical protein